MQHGEKVEGKGTRELGYFIAKIQDEYMKSYLEEFDKQYKGKQSIDIEIFDENPLSIKYARFNQSGEVCHCKEDSNEADLKTKDGFKKIQCSANCEYRKKNEQGKSACNRIAWFKFLIPSISKDRIFLMRITGQKSINRLKDYFNLQKMQGNSIKGTYTIYIRQEEQSNNLGKTFNNFILNIMPNNNFNSNKIPPQITEKTEETSKEDKPNVNKEVEQKETNTTATKSEETAKKPKSKGTNKKATVDKKETENKQIDDNKKTKESSNNDNFENCYCLLSTSYKKLKDKTGTVKEYLIGEFADMQDNIFNIVIRPDDAEELIKCDLGTVVRLDVSDRGSNKFAMKLEYVEKALKKVAA